MNSIEKIFCIPMGYDFKYSNLINRYKRILNCENLENISIESIREYANSDREYIRLFIDELVLRGYSFKSDNPNSILPKFKIIDDNIKYLYVEENLNRYLNLNLKMFGLGNFCLKYKIENDKFFNYIPLNGFKYFNSNINIDLLEKHFRELGFSIINIFSNSSNDKYNYIQERTEIEKVNEFNDYYNESLNEVDSKIEIVTCDEVFNEFLNKYSIKTLDQLLRINKNEIWFEIGIGKSRITKAEKYIQKEYGIKIPINNEFLDESEFIDSYKFSRIFKRYCYMRNIIQLKDLNKTDFIELANKNVLNYSDQKILSELMKFKLVKIIKDNEIKNSNKLSLENIEKSSDELQVDEILTNEEKGEYCQNNEELLFTDKIFHRYLRKKDINTVADLFNIGINKNELLIQDSFGIVRIKKISQELLEKYQYNLQAKNKFEKCKTEIANIHLSRKFKKYCQDNEINYLYELNNVDFSSIIVENQMVLSDIKNLLDYSGKTITNEQKLEIFLPSKIATNILKEELEKNKIISIKQLLEWDYKNVLSYEYTPRVLKDITNYLDTIGYKYQNIVSPVYKYLNLNQNTIKDLKYKAIYDYMVENNIETLDELKDFNFLNIFTSYNKKIAEEIKDIYIIDYNDTDKVINNSQIELIKEKNIYDIDFIKIYTSYEYEEFKSLIDSIDEKYTNKNLSLFVYKKLEKLKYEYEDFNLLFEKLIERKTLQELADRLGLTRERIRQKTDKLMKIFYESYLMPLKPFFIELFESEGYIDLEKLLEIYPSDDAKIVYSTLIETLTDEEEIAYIKELDIVVLENKNLLEVYDSLIDNLEDVFSYDDELDDIESYLSFNNILVPIEYFKVYLKLKNYQNIGKFICKNATIKVLFSYLIREYYKDGIVLDENGLKGFYSLIEDKLGTDFKYSKEPHAIKSIFERHLIFCDTNRYTCIENVKIDKNLIKKIKNYLEETLENVELISYNSVFEEFKNELLEKTSIDTGNYLGSILKYYYSDYFSFYRSNIEKKSKNENSNILRVEKFEEYILSRNDFVSVVEIEQKFINLNWINLLAVSDNLIYVSDNKSVVHIKYLGIDEIFLEKLQNKIESLMKFKCLSVCTLYEEIKLDCYEKNIISSDMLVSVLKLTLSGKYKYYNKIFILDNSLEEFSYEYLYDSYFETYNKIYRDDFIKFVDEYNFKFSKGMAVIDELQNYFVKVDIDTYISDKKFNYTNDDIVIIKNFIDKLLEKEYIVLNDYMQEMKNLPIKNDLYWNEFLMESVIRKYLNQYYKIVKKDNDDWRYSVPVCVKINSKINNWSDLIIYIIQEQNTNKISVTNLLKLLAVKGIKSKNLPKEFVEDNRVIIKDNNVYLMEEKWD